MVGTLTELRQQKSRLKTLEERQDLPYMVGRLSEMCAALYTTYL